MGATLTGVGERLLCRNANAQPGMPAADDRLITVVCVNCLTLPGNGESQRIAGGGDPVSRRTADTDYHIGLIHDSVSQKSTCVG
jgi:hypothetical protein